MNTNLEYFNYSKNNPEDLLDAFYAKNLVVIPSKKEIYNDLTINNERLLKLITTFDVLEESYKKDQKDEIVQKILSGTTQCLFKPRILKCYITGYVR